MSRGQHLARITRMHPGKQLIAVAALVALAVALARVPSVAASEDPFSHTVDEFTFVAEYLDYGPEYDDEYRQKAELAWFGYAHVPQVPIIELREHLGVDRRPGEPCPPTWDGFRSMSDVTIISHGEVVPYSPDRGFAPLGKREIGLAGSALLDQKKTPENAGGWRACVYLRIASSSPASPAWAVGEATYEIPKPDKPRVIRVRGGWRVIAGGFDTERGIALAERHLGAASTIERNESGFGCRVEWDDLDAQFLFYNLGIGGQCHPVGASVGSARLSGPTWRTWRGVAVGDSVAKLKRRHRTSFRCDRTSMNAPRSARARVPRGTKRRQLIRRCARLSRGSSGRFWIAPVLSRIGQSHFYPRLSAVVRGGKILRFDLDIRAGGD